MMHLCEELAIALNKHGWHYKTGGSYMHKQLTGDLIKMYWRLNVWGTRLRHTRTVLAIMVHKTRSPDAQGILNNGATWCMTKPDDSR